MKKPLLLHYYITNRCNARCSFCSIWQEKPKVDADLKDVLDNLRQGRQAGCRFVDFTGGEPLLHPQLPEFLAAAKKLGYITSVTTNCLLFTERAKEIAGLVDLLHFSIDADSAQLHDKIRGCRSYQHVLDSIKTALENKLYPDLLYTYTQENIDAIEGVWELAQKSKLILILDPVFEVCGHDRLHPDIHKKAFDFSKRKGVYLNTAHLILRDRGGNQIRDPLCRAVSSTVVILPDNKLALPCFHRRCNTPAVNGNLKELLRSKDRVEAVDREGKYSFCQGCHINCYFDPTYQFAGGCFMIESMKSKLKYAFTKYLIYRRKLPGK
ncbi:MAG: radical SAM protein [Chitinispirillales bacterium]|jgi:MoaA/NifB/PqqE/SkfB family radical SAM enzyme|nr:radical SAM protein [Chitinispirillales bacterium]